MENFFYIHSQEQVSQGTKVTVTWKNQQGLAIVSEFRIVSGDIDSFIPSFAGEIRERNSDLFIVPEEQIEGEN
jgi:hypothetical protein